MSFSLPFPSPGGGTGTSLNKGIAPPPPAINTSYAHSHDSKTMKIDIPVEKDDATHHALPRKPPHQTIYHPNNTNSLASTQAPQQAYHDTVSIPVRNSSAHATTTASHPNWHHHPRQPSLNADSYFPHSTGAYSHLPATGLNGSHLQSATKTASIHRGHSRQGSVSGGSSSAIVSSRSAKPSSQNMRLSLSSGAGNGGASQSQVDLAHFTGSHHHAGPPSPSTLTDIILGLHSTLYGKKRTQEEVRESVAAFYDQDAVFESPLLAAKGREQIANQFIMAFALPGMDVTSELRDVICSDFEFDGTRAGIIDQTISVTFLPSLFGSQSHSSSQSHYASHAVPSGHRAGSSTPGYTLQSAGVTPHPFASYSHAHTPAGGVGSMFSRFTSSRPHSPTTPYSVSSLWGSSRPHTPGALSSHIRPLSTSHRPSTPPSVNGEDEEADRSGQSHSTIHGGPHDGTSQFFSVNEAGGGQVTRPQMPVDSITPHWSADGLGRGSIRAFLWGILHPRAVLKSLCTIHLRVMSRLEFNDAGHIVRHEDTWSLRETIEGTVPFASVVYALERRVVGYLCSFAIGKGFRLSAALTRTLTGGHGGQQHQQRAWPLMVGDEKYDTDASDAARALLLGQQRQEQLQSMARSRASSPSRQRFSSHGPLTPHSHTISAGTRSRARSLIGQQSNNQPLRAASTDNLLAITNNLSGYGERERGTTTGGLDSLPPDSSARYRDRGTRRPTSSTASAPVSGGAAVSLESLWQQADIATHNSDALDSRSRAPDRDL